MSGEDMHLRAPINERLEAHDKIALAFSGGKDSLACVFLVRSYWDRIRLYHVDTGDYLPQQREIIATVEREFPYAFTRIETNVAQWIDDNGLPSDLIPHTMHIAGLMTGQAKTKLVFREDCCFANQMLPLYERVLADGNTMLIRGTKRSDLPKLAAYDGTVENGIELYHPIESWTDQQVLDYLRLSGVDVSPIYAHLEHGLSCATCPAWWNEGRGAYLKRFHPELFRIYNRRLQKIIDEVASPLAMLKREAEVA